MGQKNWEKAEQSIISAAKEKNLEFKIEGKKILFITMLMKKFNQIALLVVK